MNKIKFVLIIIFVIIVIWVAWAVWFFGQEKTHQEVNWDDPNYVFDITAPADFDEAKLQRVDMKLEAARHLYLEKPRDSWTWDTIGDLYDFIRDYDRALGAYQRALSFQPKDITATLNVANIYEKYIVDYAKAEEYYIQAIGIFPNNPDLYDRLAQLYWRKMDRVDDAEVTYLEALEKTEYHPDSLLDLINFYEKTGQIDKQKQYIRELLNRYPDNQLYQTQYGELIS